MPVGAKLAMDSGAVNAGSADVVADGAMATIDSGGAEQRAMAIPARTTPTAAAPINAILCPVVNAE